MGNVFPIRPFDGQLYIDALRVRWIYSADERCWKRDGVASEIPLASNLQPGLLSAQLKGLLDSIQPKGGHFGIIARPLLSLVPTNTETILKDRVEVAFRTESGSSIKASSSIEKSAFEENAFAGKIVRFTSGILSNQAFIIANNNDTELHLIGNASGAKPGDKFEILEPTAMNLNGIISGNIELVSESITIDCLDADDEQIDRNCKVPPKAVENRKPALDFKVSDLFKAQLCIQQPGCEGPRGDKGLKGNRGKDGTGDGPQGETGDPGKDAPQTPVQFDGIRIVDIDDIYDTAVVAIELDAENSKINVVKAKIKTPDDNTPASQLIASEIFRAVEFVGDGFRFNLNRPPVDPVGIDDVKIVYYPQGYETPTDGGSNRPQTTAVGIVNLSTFLSEATAFWQKKLDVISAKWDQDIKTFIESKDREARLALAQLCKELAECEWERPIEFCLGLNQKDCNQVGSESPTPTPPTPPSPPSPPPGSPPSRPPGQPGQPGIPINPFDLPPSESVPVSPVLPAGGGDAPPPVETPSPDIGPPVATPGGGG